MQTLIGVLICPSFWFGQKWLKKFLKTVGLGSEILSKIMKACDVILAGVRIDEK